MCRRYKEVEPTGGLERVGGGDGLDGGVEDVYRHKLDGGVDSVFKRPRVIGTCSTGRGRRKEITRHPWEIEMKKQQVVDDYTCPVCGYYSPLNGGLYRTVWGFFHDKEYELYECKRCNTEWRIRIK